MGHYVGLDVSLEETFICVVNEEGAVVWQGKSKSTPEAIAKALRRRSESVTKIGLESGPLSTWHWHSLREMRLPVICLDARHAKAALSMQINKTDANDAYGLAQIVRTGWYREVQVKSIDAHLVKTLVSSRPQLVGMRTKLTNQLRGILKTFGLVISRASGKGFEDRVREISKGQVELGIVIDSLLTVWRSICEQIEGMDRIIGAHARQNPVCRRLMTVPGVGPVTALAFTAVIDDPGRFRKSSSVGAYLGLTPRRYQSGEVDRAGRISKCGDGLMRSYLYEAANVILNRVQRWSKIKAWATRLAKRVGIKKAKVALARKLATLLYRLWVDETNFKWTEPKTA